MNKNMLFGILAGITTAVIVRMLTSSSVAQMEVPWKALWTWAALWDKIWAVCLGCSANVP